MIKFTKLTRVNIRKLQCTKRISEHGIIFRRLKNGDGKYLINIMVDGQRIHRLVGKESQGVGRQEAEQLISKLREDARQNRFNLPKGRKIILGFRQAAEKYIQKLRESDGKDIDRKEVRFKLYLCPFFENKLLAQISSFDIERYKKARAETKTKNSTINRELAGLSHFLNKAVEWKWLEHKPCLIKKFKEDNGRIVYLTIEQTGDILESAKKDECAYIYPFFMIGLATSMRRMEILSIKIEHIDFEKRIIFIPVAKAGKREQPMTENLAIFLKNYLKDISPEQTWLFPAKRSSTGHAMSIEKAFRRVVVRAGLDPKEVVRHTLRHTAITHLVQAGVDLPTVQRISGHKTLQMVVRYAHQNGAHIQAAMDKLEKRYQFEEAA
ncbi:MAG: site-specific integrase [Gammaproteobacteria bacterium]|nr:site-specific integrase [Gammaproteobacteria bacterium]